mmetsp:Transcript_1218/g.2912  ORF Transcript_1218/g.2912 Transcript_1218/m.2912 type:complete len:200 (+) Transcript_1218:39-638(+)
MRTVGAIPLHYNRQQLHKLETRYLGQPIPFPIRCCFEHRNRGNPAAGPDGGCAWAQERRRGSRRWHSSHRRMQVALRFPKGDHVRDVPACAVPWPVHLNLADVRVPPVLVVCDDRDLQQECLLVVKPSRLREGHGHPSPRLVHVEQPDLLQVVEPVADAQHDAARRVALVERVVEVEADKAQLDLLLELDIDEVRLCTI